MGMMYASLTHCRSEVDAPVETPMVVRETLTAVMGTYVTKTPSTASAIVRPTAPASRSVSALRAGATIGTPSRLGRAAP
jgi:hypothetical protein